MINKRKAWAVAEVAKIRLSSEWGARPTWVLDADGDLDDVAPAELGLSTELTADIEAWDAEFQAFYNGDDPGSSSGFPTTGAESSWIARGKALSERIAEELCGPPVEFRYHGVTCSLHGVHEC